MSYELIVQRSAKRDLRHLEPDLLDRVETKIRQLGVVPRPSGVKKILGENWRIRIGNWRVIYSVDDKKQKIFIHRVRHRSEAYRK